MRLLLVSGVILAWTLVAGMLLGGCASPLPPVQYAPNQNGLPAAYAPSH